MYRTVRGVDQVELVIVDLDDTLWRGIVAEEGMSEDTIEGWPMGVIEALQFLKKRGVLLGIISKNDESRIEALLDTIFGAASASMTSSFGRSNWKAKADDLEEILDEVNLLSRSVVFVDNNTAERAEIAAAFPDVHVLGAQLYHLKRILMSAPETQVPFVSEESTRRTQMVQGQVARERERKRVPRESSAVFGQRLVFLTFGSKTRPEPPEQSSCSTRRTSSIPPAANGQLETSSTL